MLNERKMFVISLFVVGIKYAPIFNWFKCIVNNTIIIFVFAKRVI